MANLPPRQKTGDDGLGQKRRAYGKIRAIYVLQRVQRELVRLRGPNPCKYSQLCRRNGKRRGTRVSASLSGDARKLPDCLPKASSQTWTNFALQTV